MTAVHHPRRDLLAVFHAALAAVQGRRCVTHALVSRPLIAGTVCVVAIGKAAQAMAHGAADALGTQWGAGLIITKYGHGDASFSFAGPMRVLEAGHPLPDAASLAAGQALLAFIDKSPVDAHLLFLISGGASSLVDVLPPGMGLADLRRANDWLLGSGHDIHQINRVRKGLSCIKGGRLARLLGGRPARVLLMSDVPGDDPAAIGSGLLAPDRALPLPEVPAWLRDMLTLAPHAPRADDVCFQGVDAEVVASIQQARTAAARHGRALGYAVYEDNTLITGDAMARGDELARRVCEGPPGLYVWGGETTVELPPQPGRGGRNQQLALAAARRLMGVDGAWLLSAGTDGSDGPTEDAGALVDGGTVARGEAEGLSADHCLAAADTGTFLEASGDLIQTGPTGTNVMDLMLGLKLR